MLVGLLLLSSEQLSAQDRWVAVLPEVGFAWGSQGNSVNRGIRVEVGLKGPLRAAARWARRTRVLCADDAPCPTDAEFLEAGIGVRLGGAEKVVPFADLLVGASWEGQPYRPVTTPYTSASVSLGVDLRIVPPATLRLGIRHQEVFGTNRWDGRRGSTNGVIAGLGITIH